MATWIRFEHDNKTGFGQLKDGIVSVHEGDLFETNAPTGEQLELADIRLLTPTEPTKMAALWNNYHAVAKENGIAIPETPMYLFKANSSFLATGEVIRHPPSVSQSAYFEGELGIVIGKTTQQVSPEQAGECIFGYTCINDVTAFSLLKEYPGFDQWTRSKGFDTFGVFGPAVATDINWQDLQIVTRVDGEERQNYPASDMIFSPPEVVSALSHNMTMNPGDIICCGTNCGLGPMPQGCVVEVEINGIGILRNTYR